MDTSSLACFRYALPIFFIYLISAYLSVLMVEGEDIRLNTVGDLFKMRYGTAGPVGAALPGVGNMGGGDLGDSATRSLACFRYALPIFFKYSRDAYWSVIVVEGGGIRLNPVGDISKCDLAQPPFTHQKWGNGLQKILRFSHPKPGAHYPPGHVGLRLLNQCLAHLFLKGNKTHRRS